jgi:hypothetical protein
MLAGYAQRHRKLTFLVRISACPDFIPDAEAYKASGVFCADFRSELWGLNTVRLTAVDIAQAPPRLMRAGF